MKFVAIDVETANPSFSSICQIGIAGFDGEKLCGEWKTYVNPEDYFHPVNISIHGIDEVTVEGSPTLPEIAETVRQHLNDNITVCHTHFDRAAIRQAFSSYELQMPKCNWLDSACVARRAWKEFSQKGYGLHSLCDFLGYDFVHHDALEDAKAAGFILNSAIKESGLNIEDWLERVKKPINPLSVNIGRDGNSEGPLFGEIVVFTGALEIPRREAADLAAKVGCQVDSRVTKHTTMLVVGEQDIKKLCGHEKSSKHRKAEELIQKGPPIRIIGEEDFKRMTCDE